MSADAPPHDGATCRHCGDVIGVYEPMVVLVDGEVLLSSRAIADMKLPHDAPRYHERCFALVEAGTQPDSA